MTINILGTTNSLAQLVSNRR